MSSFNIGDVVKGKVAGIQGYGAFVALDDKTQGLVHISEIRHGFVKDIHDFLELGQEVKVKVLDIDPESGKISLSIRATEDMMPEKKSDKKEPDEGFNTLRDKLQDWIRKADK